MTRNARHPVGRMRLGPEDYRQLKFKILERDGWKCQRCGRRDQLQIHHIVHRSQSGADCDDNLVTLCNKCHTDLHFYRSDHRSAP